MARDLIEEFRTVNASASHNFRHSSRMKLQVRRNVIHLTCDNTMYHIHSQASPGREEVQVYHHSSKDKQISNVKKLTFSRLVHDQKCVCSQSSVKVKPRWGSLQRSLTPSSVWVGDTLPPPKISPPISAFGLNFQPFEPKSASLTPISGHAYGHTGSLCNDKQGEFLPGQPWISGACRYLSHKRSLVQQPVYVLAALCLACSGWAASCKQTPRRDIHL